MEPKRILKEIDVQFISLVDKGANGKTIIYKSANQSASNLNKEIKIIRKDDDKHLVYGTVYEPDSVDTQGDTAGESAVEKSAHNFLMKLHNKNVDTQHDFVADDGAVVESFILRAADPMFPDTKIGSWVVAIKVAKDETWDKIKKGEITGLSLAGVAVVEEVKKKTLSQAVKSFFTELRKDFNEELALSSLRDKIYALTDSFYQIMDDDTVTDKKAAILASVTQFQTAISAEQVTKITLSPKQEEVEMKPEEITKAIADALKPVTDQLTKLDGDVKAISGRVETVEKATPGSTQIAGEVKPVKKSIFGY